MQRKLLIGRIVSGGVRPVPNGPIHEPTVFDQPFPLHPRSAQFWMPWRGHNALVMRTNLTGTFAASLGYGVDPATTYPNIV